MAWAHPATASAVPALGVGEQSALRQGASEQEDLDPILGISVVEEVELPSHGLDERVNLPTRLHLGSPLMCVLIGGPGIVTVCRAFHL